MKGGDRIGHGGKKSVGAQPSGVLVPVPSAESTLSQLLICRAQAGPHASGCDGGGLFDPGRRR